MEGRKQKVGCRLAHTLIKTIISKKKQHEKKHKSPFLSLFFFPPSFNWTKVSVDMIPPRSSTIFFLAVRTDYCLFFLPSEIFQRKNHKKIIINKIKMTAVNNYCDVLYAHWRKSARRRDWNIGLLYTHATLSFWWWYDKMIKCARCSRPELTFNSARFNWGL